MGRYGLHRGNDRSKGVSATDCRQMPRLGQANSGWRTAFYSCPEDFDDVDYLVLNEAEITLPLFLRDLVAGSPRRV